MSADDDWAMVFADAVLTGNSLTNLLFSEKSGVIDKEREFVVSAFEELYNKKEDPAMIHNLVTEPEYENKLKELRQKLTNYLKQTKDPGVQGNSPWDYYNLDKPDGQVAKN